VKSSLALNSWSLCLNLLSSGITDMYDCTQLPTRHFNKCKWFHLALDKSPHILKHTNNLNSYDLSTWLCVWMLFPFLILSLPSQGPAVDLLLSLPTSFTCCPFCLECSFLSILPSIIASQIPLLLIF
jgi:hypothetical protein